MRPLARYRVAVVDDHRLVRQGMIEILSTETDFEVVAEGGSAEDAMQVARETAPDLVFLDVNMPGGGLAAAERIRQSGCAARILMFSFRQDADIVQACLAAGADGYVVKGTSGPDLIAAARKVLAGCGHVDPLLPHLLAREGGGTMTIGELVGSES